MTEKDEQHLQAETAKGARAREILHSGGWMQDVVPYLLVREAELSKGSSWKPGGPATAELVAMGCAYNGGRQDECLNLRNVLEIWAEQGRVAAEKLEQERNKK